MGLLDQFSEFAKTPEGQGLLSAAFGGLAGARRGEPINSLGRAGLAGMAGYSGAIDRQNAAAENAVTQQYRGMQMDAMRAEIEAKRKHAEALAMLSNPLAAGASVGDIGPTKSNAARQEGMSRIPQSAIQADIALNGGKNLSEWLFKMGAPDMQVSNGYVFDKNSIQPGYLPGMSVSNDGKATQTVIGPDGQPQVRAPAGAVELFGTYQDVAERAKASYDPQTVTLPDGRTVITNRASVVAPAGQTPQPRPGQPFKSGYAGGSAAAADGDRLEILNGELAKAQRDGRTQDVISIRNEISRLSGGKPEQTGLPVPGIEVQNEAGKVASVETARNTAANAQAVQKDRATARKFLNQAKFAEELLNKGPTGSGAGAVMDNVLGFFGQSTPSSETAKQLEAVSGWLVSNVPRMEGPQSNFDVDNYMRMAGAVGDKTKPVKERLAALKTIQKMMGEVIDGGQAKPEAAGKTVVRRGVYGGRKVVQYSDGSTEYAD